MEQILVVDDDEGTLRLLEKTLTTEGYKILTASTGNEAVTKAQRYLPDLVIMDIMLPDIEGSEAVAKLRGIPSTHDIPVIFLTSMLGKKDEAPQIKVGGYLYDAIAKPFSHHELTRKIRKVFEG